jgi:late competence protein required for DNA uptake (superfamily II DNA/RNA helicase)
MSEPVIGSTLCKRCEGTFRFIKRAVGRPRLYCEPCRELEAVESSRIYYALKTKPDRLAARANAIKCHEEA